MTTSVLTQTGAWRGTDVLRVWVEFNHRSATGAAQTFTWSGIPIAHASTRYSGYKDPRVITFGQYTLARSDEWGRLESTVFSFTLRDYDNLVRAWFENLNQVGLWNTEVIVRQITVADDIAGLDAAIRFRGVVQKYEMLAGFQTKFTCTDRLSALLNQPPPLRLISLDFPGAPTSSLAQYAPICLGPLSDEAGSATGAPVPAAESGTGCTAVALNTSYVSPINPADPIYAGLPGSQVALAGFTSMQGVAGAPAAPTAISLVQQAASGGSPGNYLGNNINGEGAYRCQVRAMNGAVPSDPYPFLFEDPAGLFSPNTVNVQIAASWTPGVGGPTPTGYELSEGQLGDTGSPGFVTYYRPDQIDPSASASFTVNQAPHSSDPIALTQCCAGARLPDNTTRYAYVVTAIVGGAETAPSAYWVTRPTPWNRWYRLCWTPVVGATAYNVYRSVLGLDGSIAGFDLAWKSATTTTNGSGNIVFTDDLSGTGSIAVSGIGTSTSGTVGPQGVVPCIPVGSRIDSNQKTWQAFLACAHSLALPLPNLYLRNTKTTPATVTVISSSRFGVDVDVPGQASFSSRWGQNYYDAPSGYRYFLIYLSGSDAAACLAGTEQLYINTQGTDTVGDCSGSPVVNWTDWFAQFLDNYVLPDTPYAGGNWRASPPTWADGTSRRDTASFTAAWTAFTTLFTTAGQARTMRISDPSSRQILDYVAAATVEAEHAYLLTKPGQFRLKVVPPDPSAPSATFAVDERLDVAKGKFSWLDYLDNARFYNNAPYTFQLAYDVSGGETAQGSGTADTPANRTTYANGALLVASQTLAMITVRDAAAASQVMARRLGRQSMPTRPATIRAPLYLIEPDPGDLGTVTHREGTGLSGWLNRRAVLHRLSPLLDLGQVDLEVWDTQDQEFPTMLAGQTEFLGGDNNNQITNTSYPTGATTWAAGTALWTVDSANLPGSYQLQGMGIVVGSVTLKVGLFNLTDAPNTPLVELTFTNTTALTNPAVTTAITFAVAGAAKTYGLKAYISGGSGFFWGCSVVRTA